MLEDEICKRVSIRKYKEECLDNETIDKIINIISTKKPLFKNLNYNINLVLDGKSFQKVLGGIVGSYGKIHAPHYLVASIKDEENAYENIGYILENVVLELTKMNIGTCWIGGGIKRDLFIDFLELDEGYRPIIVIAFGYPLGRLRNDKTQYKRKRLDQIAHGKYTNYTEVMEYVRVAPSAVNLQPWRYHFELENLVHIYRVKHNFLLKNHFEDLNKVDLGISICHFEIGINKLNKKVTIIDMDKEREKLIYFRTLQIT